MRTWTKLALLPLLMLSTVGCGTPLKSPTATLNYMNVTDVTPKGFTMTFDMNVENPNSVPLPLSQADYALALGGTKVMEGKAAPSGTIPADGALPVKLPVTISYENLLAAEKAIAGGGGKVPYALTGSLGATASAASGRALGGLLGAQTVSVPLKYQGQLDVKELLRNPQALMESPAAKKLAADLVTNLLNR